MYYYQYNINDTLAETRHLTHVERSLYRELTDVYLLDEQPFNKRNLERLKRRVMAISEEEINAFNFVLEEFFVLDDDVYRNEKLDLIIAEFQEKREKQSKAGKASAKARASNSKAFKEEEAITNQTNVDIPLNNQSTSVNDLLDSNSTDVQQTFNECSTDVQPTINHKPITNNQYISPHTPQGDFVVTTEPPQGFADFWENYPNTNGRRKDKHKCLTLWKKQKLETIAKSIVEHVKAMRNTKKWQSGYEPLCLTYLNGRQWQDGLPDEKSSNPTWDLKDYNENKETVFYDDGSESF